MVKRKLLVTIPSFKGGGAERVIINMANNLDRDKFDIYLMVIDGTGPYKKNVHSNIKIIDLNTSRLRYALKRIIKTVNEINPHVILSTLGHLNLVMLALKGKFKSNPKIIVRLANTPSRLLQNMKYKDRVLMKLLTQKLYSQADLIVAQCKEMKIDFIESFQVNNSKVDYIYNPIDIETIKASITRENPFDATKVNFLGVGRLTYQKGFDILLKSFKRVSQEIPSAELTILGTGELEKEYRLLAKELNIENIVNFVGFVNNPYNYYYYSDVYVLSSRFEGFPNSLLEALACGAKVVSTNCKSGPTEILDNKYGVMANVEDVDSLAEAMITAYKKSNMSSNRAEYYNINKIVKEYEELLLEH